MNKIFRNRANEYVSIEKAFAGDIVVFSESDLASGDYVCLSGKEPLGVMRGFDKVEPLFH